MNTTDTATWPQIRTAGYDGFLISFGDALNEPANRAALAYRAALERAELPGAAESSTSLVSAYLRFDPLKVSHLDMQDALQKLLGGRDWYAADLPEGRKLWRVPTVFGGDMGGQLEETAKLTGMTLEQAIASISETQVRVQTIGFAPGMPYLGALPAQWNIPRQTDLTAKVPAGGLCVALRQLVLFPVSTPTGWRHIGQTNLRLFRPEADDPFVLRPGDEVLFHPVTEPELSAIRDDPNGGATCQAIA